MPLQDELIERLSAMLSLSTVRGMADQEGSDAKHEA